MSERLQQLISFLEENPNDPFLKYALATENLKTGNKEEALSRFEQLIQEHPDYVGTYYHLGKLLESLNRPDDAKKIYEQGMEVARMKRNQHALSELQGAWRMVQGMDEDDEDW